MRWHADSQRTDLTGGRGQLVDEAKALESEPPVVVTEPGTHAHMRQATI